MASRYGSLPFEAQIAFFRKKLALPSRSWSDIWQSEHDHAFVVAGATQMSLVEDLQAAVQKAIEKGTTIAEFRKDFDAAVAAHGWSYRGTRGWRTRVIYETNLKTSHAAGRYAQLQKFEYWQYHHSPVSQDPRPEHVDWNKHIWPKDDPIWQVIYPPNGWGCNCYVTGVSSRELMRRGLSVSDPVELEWEEKQVGIRGPNPRTVRVPKGISPGWAYAPGRSSWMHAHVPPARGDSPVGFEQMIPARAARDLLPDARPSEAPMLPAIQPGEEAGRVRAFLQKFGGDIGKPVLFTDASGESIVLSEAMFQDHLGNWKVGKGSRAIHLELLAQAIHDPDEIWAWMEWHQKSGRAVVRRVYLSRLQAGSKRELVLNVFEYGSDGWAGITAHTSQSSGDFNRKVEKNRRGVRLFRRGP